MATIRKWVLREHCHPLDIHQIVSREIHMEGEFTQAEWDAVCALFWGMRARAEKAVPLKGRETSNMNPRP